MDHCIIFGAPRSGTTFLHKAVGLLHGAEGMIGQLVPVVVFHLAKQDLSPKEYRALCGTLQRSIDIYLSGEYNSRFRALQYWWQAPFQWSRMIHVFRSGRRPRPDLFVYKEPFLSLAPEFALDALPEAKLIYITRDGRDVANSLVETYGVLTDEHLTHFETAEMRIGRSYEERYVPWWVGDGREKEFLDSSPYVRAIWMWKYMVQQCQKYFEDMTGRENVLEISYETFMRQPHPIGNRILDHLGKKDTRVFRRHLNSSRTSPIGRYENRSVQEIQEATSVAEPLLSDLGYREGS